MFQFLSNRKWASTMKAADVLFTSSLFFKNNSVSSEDSMACIYVRTHIPMGRVAGGGGLCLKTRGPPAQNLRSICRVLCLLVLWGPLDRSPLPVHERSRPDSADGWTPEAEDTAGVGWGWAHAREGGCIQSRVIRGNVFPCVGGDGPRVSWTLLIHYCWALLQVASCRHAEPERVVMWQVGMRERRLCTSARVCKCLWCAVIAALSLDCYRLSAEAQYSLVPHFFSQLFLLLQGRARPADINAPALFWGALTCFSRQDGLFFLACLTSCGEHICCSVSAIDTFTRAPSPIQICTLWQILFLEVWCVSV